jgi:hypothetical protein
MSIVDLSIFRDAHLIVESESVKGLAGVIKWTITGEKQDIVAKASNALMSAAGIDSASFTFPGKIVDKTDAKHRWFRTVGYTSENKVADAHRLQKENE